MSAPIPHSPASPADKPAITSRVVRCGNFEIVITSGVSVPTRRAPKAAPWAKSTKPAKVARDRPDTGLRAALSYTASRRWRGMASHKSNISLSELAIETLEDLTQTPGISAATINRDTAAHRAKRKAGEGDGSLCLLEQAADLWSAQGLAPGSIIRRLNCLSTLGVDVRGCRPRNPRKLKWWLKPEDEARAIAWLLEDGREHALVLADYIEWATRVGPRVTESLRLEWSDVQFRADGRVSVTVPGLKTAHSQATLPISLAAAAVLLRAKARGCSRPFPATYQQLLIVWIECRAALGFGIKGDPKTATLRAFRRSAARNLHVGTQSKKAMPLDAVRQYLRHENVNTTMGYLRLTGGYSEEEMQQWLD